MINKLQAFSVILATTILVGCASTTIYPGPNGSCSLVTTSGEQGYAEKDAEKKAAKYCAGIGKKLVVINHQTKYNGIDKTHAALVGLASAILVPGAGNMAKSNQDYEVTMNFKCE